MVKLLRLLAIGISFLPLVGIRSTQSAEIKIVSPSAYEDTEGEGTTNENCCDPFHAQQVFPAEDFAALGNQPHWLVDFNNRPDQSVTSPLTFHNPDLEIRFTTMPVGPPNLSLGFDDNLGSNFMHWYRGPATFVADVEGPGPGPREFYNADHPAGVTPYLYDPSQGNLLLDVIARQGLSPSHRGDRTLSTQTALVGSPFATQGEPNTASIWQFTFIPVLETPVATWNVDAGGNWSLPANWAGGVPNITDARAVLGSFITAPRTVTVNTAITVGRLDFDNANAYTIAGPQALTLDAMSGDAQINVATGSHTISAPVALADNATITVTPVASNLALTGELNSFGHNLTKAGAGTLTLNNIRAAGLSVIGGTVAVAPNGINAATSVIGALSIAGTPSAPAATFDLADNAVVVDYTGTSPAATLRQQIIAGRGGAGLGKTWNGPGITSSEAEAAATTEPESSSVGFAENATMPLGPYTNFRGQPVDSTSLLLIFTRTGDANLDGVVNDDDVTIVGAAYAPGVPNAAWALGDFDYNGFIDDDDVTLLGAFYDPSASPVMATSGDVAAVPDPGSLFLALLAAAGVGLFIRRRQN